MTVQQMLFPIAGRESLVSKRDRAEIETEGLNHPISRIMSPGPIEDPANETILYYNEFFRDCIQTVALRDIRSIYRKHSSRWLWCNTVLFNLSGE
jgi:hypothetical protein